MARPPRRRYNAGMRRSLRFGLAAAALLVLCGAYTAFWFVAAGRIEDGLGQWAEAQRAQNVDLSWDAIRVGGFPFAFRVELSAARLRGRASDPGGEARMPLLEGSTRPWNFRVWQLTARDGISATAGPANRPTATLRAHTASGSVAVGADGGAAIWLRLGEPDADAGMRLAARQADLWLDLPPHPPQTHTEQALGIALYLRDLTLPAAPAPLPNPLDEVSLGVTRIGAAPAAPLRQAAAAWRDGGGTLELDHFALRWGKLAITGAGTLALDADLQPVGSFSGAVEGYPELMAALVAAGRIRAGDAQLAGLALAMLSRAGPDGRPQIATSFRIQNGQMYLGPAKLGPVPRINWE